MVDDAIIEIKSKENKKLVGLCRSALHSDNISDVLCLFFKLICRGLPNPPYVWHCLLFANRKPPRNETVKTSLPTATSSSALEVRIFKNSPQQGTM